MIFRMFNAIIFLNFHFHGCGFSILNKWMVQSKVEVGKLYEIDIINMVDRYREVAWLLS
jgi:hypothetical protein